MQIPIHVWVREGRHVFGFVFVLEGEGLITWLGLGLCLLSCEQHLLHLDFDLAQMIVALAALLLLFFGTFPNSLLLLGDGLGLSWLLLCCGGVCCRGWLSFRLHIYLLLAIMESSETKVERKEVKLLSCFSELFKI